MAKIKDSQNTPLIVDFLPRDSLASFLGRECHLGLCMAPGRQKAKARYVWRRDLNADLDRLVDEYKTDVLVTCLRDQEMININVANLFSAVTSRGMVSLHFPIPDKWIPSSLEGLTQLVARILALLKGGSRVVVHCNGGKGRSALVLACCLMAGGHSTWGAVKIIQKARDGTLQNPLQKMYAWNFRRKWFDQPRQIDPESKEAAIKKSAPSSPTAAGGGGGGGGGGGAALPDSVYRKRSSTTVVLSPVSAESYDPQAIFQRRDST